ncbi:hypothetical protein EAH68_02025 [Corynebacterium hylobatis]|uniref:Tetratricopeptide repeat protein n=1 Tax=Corynebacterium hylobatis TaxID=1859290 RepID=A0A430I1G8_9CORY|nr:hypothetical protein [Corynebacterium hylobatis]RSZ65554.1 hypothetical protein EAH68_02025 [Corynebacterium hylobatis]
MHDQQTSPDPVMETITRAVGQWQESGDSASARERLLTLWAEIGVTGDAFHRCILAHYLADLYDDPAEALIWDIRALDAADAVPAQGVGGVQHGFNIASFRPSLYLNIADNLRQLGSFTAAVAHLDAATHDMHLLAEDAYGGLIRDGMKQVGQAITRGDCSRLGQSPASDSR